jgi:hypothetical protein
MSTWHRAARSSRSAAGPPSPRDRAGQEPTTRRQRRGHSEGQAGPAKFAQQSHPALHHRPVAQARLMRTTTASSATTTTCSTPDSSEALPRSRPGSSSLATASAHRSFNGPRHGSLTGPLAATGSVCRAPGIAMTVDDPARMTMHNPPAGTSSSAAYSASGQGDLATGSRNEACIVGRSSDTAVTSGPARRAELAEHVGQEHDAQ